MSAQGNLGNHRGRYEDALLDPETEQRFGVFLEYAKRFSSDAHPSKRAHAKTWVARRCCIEDWILSVYVSRSTRTAYEVALFLAEDHFLFERGSGVKAGVMFLLSDAYHRTGRMELTFLGPRNGKPTFEIGHEPDIPASIQALAENLAVSIERRVEEHGRLRKTFLGDGTGRELYARITGLSEHVVSALSRPESQIDLTRACFIVQRGAWSAEQVEYLAAEARKPSLLLEGGTVPENRLLFQHDLSVLRTMLVWERTKTMLEMLSSVDGAVITPTVWSGNLAKFVSNRDLQVNTVAGNLPIQAGHSISVMLLPRPAQGYRAMHCADTAAIKGLNPTLLAVTSDYCELAPSESVSDSVGIHVLLDSLAEIDAEAYRRLARSASTRRPMPEHPE